MSSNTEPPPRPSLPADLANSSDAEAFIPYRDKLLAESPYFVPMDPNLPPHWHAGLMFGNTPAHELWPDASTDRHQAVLRAAAEGKDVRMTGVDFAQYKSEVHVERDESGRRDLRVWVKGMLKVRARSAEGQTVLFVIVHVPAWQEEILLIPMGALQTGWMKREGDWLVYGDLTEWDKDVGETLEQFWDRCRANPQQLKAGQTTLLD